MGYVGLPVALAAARVHGTPSGGTGGPVVAFDRDAERIKDLRDGRDRTGVATAEELADDLILFTSDATDLAAAEFHIVTVPTPVDSENRPDLSDLLDAMDRLGPHLRPGSVVAVESTLYPGATEGVCGPRLEAASGLVCGEDFKLVYSPERINPGDGEHAFGDTVKIIAGQDAVALEMARAVYGPMVPAGLHEVSCIAAAEAAKTIENTQRDLNIALMNEFAQVLDALDLDTGEVLAAAATKWNFHAYRPGLVGGHCIGVDPWYLAARAREVGVDPRMVLAGRAVNDGMPAFVARRVAEELEASGADGRRVLLLGLTYKDGVPDTRHSLLPALGEALVGHGLEVAAWDPLADLDHLRETGDRAFRVLTREPEVSGERTERWHALLLARAHGGLVELAEELCGAPTGPALLADLTGTFGTAGERPWPDGVRSWAL
jgi:UDP-N-acetyl-D-galactosamine dehydrogenase